jgi:hypothetical protein
MWSRAELIASSTAALEIAAALDVAMGLEVSSLPDRREHPAHVRGTSSTNRMTTAILEATRVA